MRRRSSRSSRRSNSATSKQARRAAASDCIRRKLSQTVSNVHRTLSLCRIRTRDGAKGADSSGDTGGIANDLYAAYILSNNKISSEPR
jgi:hypothetical protein